MTAKKVFVTGAAGQTGIHTVKWLTQEGRNLEVWAGVHGEEREQQESQLRRFKCSPCVAEASDPKQLMEHFQDVQDLFIIPSSTPDKVQLACNYIDAAKASNVKFVLLLSVLGANRKDYSWGAQFHQIEEYLKNSKIPSWCIIRTPFYAQNLLLYREQLSNGQLPLPTSDGKFTLMDVADVGRLAGSIIANCAPHAGKTYEITGLEAINGKEMAELFSKVLQRPIEFRDITLDEARSILKQQSVPEVEIKGLADFYELAKRGFFSTISQDFTQVVGSPPKSIYDYLVENKTELA